MRFNHQGVIGEIDNLPGCSQVAVFHSVFTPQERNKGLEAHSHKLRIEEAQRLGYSMAICTINEDNKPQKTILISNNWQRVAGVVSPKTDNAVSIWVKHL